MPESRHLKPISEVTFGKWSDPSHPFMDFSIGNNVSVKRFINSRVREGISTAFWQFRWQRTCLQCRKPGIDTLIRKIPWRRIWLATPLFLPGDFHGQMNLAVYSPWRCKESDTSDGLSTLLSNVYTVSNKYHSYRFIALGGTVGTHIITPKMYDFCKVLHNFPYISTIPVISYTKRQVSYHLDSKITITVKKITL